MSDSKTRLSTRVTDYAAARPTYPRGVVEALRRSIAFNKGWRVVDVGAGTGISTALFLDAGNDVTSVEPNAPMRSEAERTFASNGRFASVAGAAEATTLPDASADLIVAAQAFHWFDHEAFARECHRLLTPRGQVLLMWNMYQPTATPAAAAYWEVARTHAIDLSRIESKWAQGKDVARAWFTPESFVEIVIDNPIAYDFESLLARLASSSYMPQRDAPGFEAMKRDLRAAFDQHALDSVYTLPNACEIYFGKPV